MQVVRQVLGGVMHLVCQIVLGLHYIVRQVLGFVVHLVREVVLGIEHVVRQVLSLVMHLVCEPRALSEEGLAGRRSSLLSGRLLGGALELRSSRARR